MNGVKIGTIGWVDLTVEDAAGVRDFYREVVGWEPSGVDMGGYDDYNMSPPGGPPQAGICHSRGANAEIPPAWIVYIVVGDLDESLRACRARGGEVVVGPRDMGDSRYAVIRDPAGAACALWQPGEAASDG